MTGGRTPRRLAGTGTAFALALLAVPAEAHLNSTGMGPFYDGLIHFLTSPEDLVPVLAVALLAGLRDAAHGRRVLFALPSAWLLGWALGLTAAAADANPNGLMASLWFVLLGGLLAAGARLSLRVTTALACVVGLVHGYFNGTGMGQSGPAIGAALGVASAVFVLIAVAAAFALRLHAHWARIAVRVGGSWIAASGLLMLGWVLRAGQT